MFRVLRLPSLLVDANASGFPLQMEELQDRLEADYAAGEIIKEKIIPHAVDWFTGEALAYDMDDEYGSEGDYSDDDDEGSHDDEDEDDEEDDEDEPPKKGSKANKP